MSNVTRLMLGPEVEATVRRERQARQIAELYRRRTEIAAFQARFAPMPTVDTLPAISWAAVRRQLEELAWTRRSRSMVYPLLEELKSRAAWQTPEMVVRGLILLAGLVLDEQSMSEPTSETGEAPMP